MDIDFGGNPVVGQVHQVGGAQAGIRLAPAAHHAQATTVGNLIGLRTPEALVIGVMTSAGGAGPAAQGVAAQGSTAQGITATIDLLGEIGPGGRGAPRYRRGVTAYPEIGDPVVLLTPRDLDVIFSLPGEEAVSIGELRQNRGIPANVKVDDLLTKHFAVLGSTGVGKSSGVSVLVGAIIERKPDLRILFIDPHNEYGSCFGPHADVVRPKSLRLPFWLFNFEEFVDVLFRGRPGVEEEVGILAELIPLAKAMYAGGRHGADRSLLKRAEARGAGFSADAPVPYRLPDLIALIEERRGKLENRALVFNYTRLLGRIEAVRADPRYAFMFENATLGGDPMVEVISDLFKYPGNGRTVTVLQLAGFPAEVVDSLVSVVCRMAFEIGLWSDGTLPLLLVCEEAHRYAPADRSMGFGPTRKALSRIAKEGRKYGIYLGIVTQRAAELDSTIISQCSTVFAMRMTNDRDQAILRAAVSDGASSLLGFVPSLGTREALAFGEGTPLPTRIRFSELPPHRLPRSEAAGPAAFRAAATDRGYVASIVERWRGPGPAFALADDGPLAASPITSPPQAAPQAPTPYPPVRLAQAQPRFGLR
ncbi:protein of unknown function DUF87 [Methylobacterium sp. 4-46]|uniref:ATP-binding protein n=1 Tax=unclassified Methylobacterium TaxID=2615210 RepID=UPI000165CCBA|nr:MULTISPECIES: ATP-binding protein [unclassified Methylobacterium]ACA20032.1 protein of unknown function DUF87 [Methylobacterium sp. 4-46]